MSAPASGRLVALDELYQLAMGDHGGSNVAAKFLLGLYNGTRFPFDLTEFRRLDQHYMECALRVLAMDWRPQLEVHAQLAIIKSVPRVRMSYQFESWAHQWRLKGRCKKENLNDLQARAFPEEAPA